MYTNTHANQQRDTADSDVGASTVEVLGWAAMSTMAIVAVGTALQVLGLDLIEHVRTQLGI